MPVVRKTLDTSVLVAVRRDENGTNRYLHPSFSAIRMLGLGAPPWRLVSAELEVDDPQT